MAFEPGALDGIGVLDLTRVLAGPMCTMWLGDLGADVIKVEQPGRGDDTRSWGPPFAGGESAYFLGVNRNKRSIAIDLKSERGRDIVRRLARDADVVVDNFKMGTLERWGMGEEWFEEHAPRTVRCTISGYGSVGPKAGMPGYDFILQAESGLMAITGEPDGESMKLGVAIVDVCTGMMATISILAALEARRRTGRGQRTEVSLFDTGLQMLANVASNTLVSGVDAARYGNGHPNIVPYRTYAAADGELAVAVGNDAQFGRLAAIVGHPEWAEDERFASNAARVENREAIDGLVAAEMARRSRAEWVGVLDEVGIPSGPINSVSEALGSPHATERQMVVHVDHPTAGVVGMLGSPFRFGATPASVRRPPPRLGEHSVEILRERLGLRGEQVDDLTRSGIIEEPKTRSPS